MYVVTSDGRVIAKNYFSGALNEIFNIKSFE